MVSQVDLKHMDNLIDIELLVQLGQVQHRKSLEGKKMAGRMGSETITIANREIVDIKDNLILIKGPIPGPKESLIAIYTK